MRRLEVSTLSSDNSILCQTQIIIFYACLSIRLQIKPFTDSKLKIARPRISWKIPNQISLFSINALDSSEAVVRVVAVAVYRYCIAKQAIACARTQIGCSNSLVRADHYKEGMVKTIYKLLEKWKLLAPVII